MVRARFCTKMHDPAESPRAAAQLSIGICENKANSKPPLMCGSVRECAEMYGNLQRSPLRRVRNEANGTFRRALVARASRPCSPMLHRRDDRVTEGHLGGLQPAATPCNAMQQKQWN